MSFIRAAASSSRAIRSQIGASARRRYATAADPSKPSNLPLYLGGAGLVGLAAYVYINFSAKAATSKAQQKSPLDPQNFVEFKLKHVEPYNHNTAKYVFELPDGHASLLPIASCVVVKSAEDSPHPLNDEKGKPIIRPYTPISPPEQEGELNFLIKHYDNGRMSKYIYELKPGEKLAIKGPIMKIPYKINEHDQVGMIAGGTGITPMYQILEYALKDPSNKTKFTLIFANISERDILLREEFDALKKAHPDTFNVIYTLDQPGSNWKGYKGYVNREMIKQNIAPATLGDKVKVFVCGPPGQVSALAGKKDGMKQGTLSGILKDLGYTEDQVFKF
ncbi:ferredoxin reductase-like protein [Laetiporus sulphureus 93-53]|uniref:NADH-cytochrome b5 reductase n=1 Tax=Laetiporus sulphureus 93-53 TaxID=1314785 RepID=A0A165C2R9_9APHY|nr:ferredoxin reductase-like protein [Laetiporus sulphureus 93-53]KZT02097.1 ferredoxin reductase-like protein [Laetiporus sulphureus 93-53]